MLLRVFYIFLMLLFCTSCDYFIFNKKKDINKLDTIVDFSSVDVSPSFPICDSVINKEKKTDCFRNTIHQLISDELSNTDLTIKDSVNEVVSVSLFISLKGEIIFKELKSSKKINENFPELKSLIEQSVRNLPKVYPAIKRGIPVLTKYTLPILIRSKKVSY